MERETLWRGRIVTLERLGGRFEVVRHASAVAVLALQGGLVLGVRQQRPAIARETWEMPAGLIDPGEAPEAAAERELREETQLTGTFRHVSRMFASPGFTDEEVHLFEARDLHPAEGVPDEEEELRIEWRDPLEVWREVAAGSLATSAVTVVGLRHALATAGIRP